MNAVEVSERAIDAWNSHDADALIAQYAEDATYHTPRFDHPLKGQAIGDFLKSVLIPTCGSMWLVAGTSEEV